MITSKVFFGEYKSINNAGEIARAMAASTAGRVDLAKTARNIEGGSSPSRGYVVCYHDGNPLGLVEFDIKKNELRSSVGYFPNAGTDRGKLIKEAEEHAYLRLIGFAHRKGLGTRIPITDYWRPSAKFKEKASKIRSGSTVKPVGIGIRTLLVHPPGWRPEVTRRERISEATRELARDMHSDLSTSIKGAWSRRPLWMRRPRRVREAQPVRIVQQPKDPQLLRPRPVRRKRRAA